MICQFIIDIITEVRDVNINKSSPIVNQITTPTLKHHPHNVVH